MMRSKIARDLFQESALALNRSDGLDTARLEDKGGL